MTGTTLDDAQLGPCWVLEDAMLPNLEPLRAVADATKVVGINKRSLRTPPRGSAKKKRGSGFALNLS